MARIRSIKPAFFKSAQVAGLPSCACRITWVGLWTYCDDSGRGVDDPRLVKAEVWPLDDKVPSKVVEGHLRALVGTGMVCRYVVSDRRFLHVVNWGEHQRISHPKVSELPACPVHDSRTVSGGVPEAVANGSGGLLEASGKILAGSGSGSGSGIGNREVEGELEKELSSSVVHLQEPVDKGVDDDNVSGENGQDVVDGALGVLAGRDLASRETDKGPVGDRRSWLAEARQRRTRTHAPMVDELRASGRLDGLTAEGLADLLDPPAPVVLVRRDYDHGRVACSRCEGVGVFTDERGMAHRCDHRGAVGA